MQEMPGRIAMLSVHTSPLASLGGKETGGMNVYVRNVSQELGARGYYVDIFTRYQCPELPPLLEDALGPRTRIVHIDAGRQAPYHRYSVWQHLPEFLTNLKQFVAERGISYDLIHSHHWLSSWVGMELKKEWRIPLVHMFHTLGQMKNSVAQREEEGEPPERIETEGRIADAADRIVAASPVQQDNLVSLYGADPARIAIIPCGVDTALFYPRPVYEARIRLELPCQHRMVLFVGRIEPLKGIDTLLRAMALVSEAHPAWRGHLCLVVIGGDADPDRAHSDPEMEYLRRLEAELGLEDLVTFMGAQSQDLLPYYYSAAQVVVIPSHYESFGMVALEAMACGTPVIASDVGGLSYTVRDGETGYLVRRGDPEALADRIAALLFNRALAKKLGSSGRAFAQEYRWDLIVHQIDRLYEEVLSSHRGESGQLLRCGARQGQRGS